MNTPRYQHIRFHALKLGEDFFYRRQRYTKTAYFLGRTVLDGRAVVVMPWTRVRSTRHVGKVKPGLLPLELQTLTGEGPIVDVIRPLNVLTRPPQEEPANPHFGKSAANDCDIPPGNTGLGGVALREPLGAVQEFIAAPTYEEIIACANLVGVDNIHFGEVRPPVPVTPGGDRRSETIGGSELTPSS